MFGENDQVALTAPIPFEQAEHVPELSPLRESSEGLLPGDVGTIVDVHGKGKAFTVEFLVPDTYGYPVAITTVGPEQLRPATGKDLDNCRFRKYSAQIVAAIPTLKQLQAEERA